MLLPYLRSDGMAGGAAPMDDHRGDGGGICHGNTRMARRADHHPAEPKPDLSGGTGTAALPLGTAGGGHPGVCLPLRSHALAQRTADDHRPRLPHPSAATLLRRGRRGKGQESVAPAERRCEIRQTHADDHRQDTILRTQGRPQRLHGLSLPPRPALSVCLQQPHQGGYHRCPGCRRAVLRQLQHPRVRPL